MKFQNLTLLFLCSTLIFSGCSMLNTRDPNQMAAVGGVGGTALGAGAGALIGTLISNGDVAGSTLLGAGVGLPVGAVGSYYYTKIRNERELGALDDKIEDNKHEILTTETYIQTRKRTADDESFLIEPDSSVQEDLYVGPSLGNPYR